MKPTWTKKSDWKNGKSYITGEEMFTKYPEVVKKIGDVLYDDTYFSDVKIFTRSVLEFAVDQDFITWKQYYALIKAKTTKERIRLYHKTPKKKLPFIYKTSNTTDREYDKLAEGIFGKVYYGEENEGYTRSYRDDGSRYFSLPTGREKLIDFI